MDWPILTSQPPALLLAALALAGILAVYFIRRFTRKSIERKGHPLPPGPTPLPLLGNALSIRNPHEPWVTYTEWHEKYGNIMYVRLLDMDMIVLSSYSDAVELLEKRSQIYSDRPFIASVEPYGHDTNVAFFQYGPRWRLCRRIIHQTFRAEAIPSFYPMQLRRARQVVVNIMDNPNEYPSHLSTFAASVGMSVIYDYEPQPRGDPMVKVVDDFCKFSVPALTSEYAVLLKVFPFLLSVPEWVPGLSWVRRTANKAHALSREMMDRPYELVQKRMRAKEDIDSDTMVFDHIKRMEKLDASQRTEYGEALKQASSTSFLGSAETTSSSLMTFTLAMVKNPRVWKRAQAEIDDVIGRDRLPDFDDRPSLPYVEAIMRETFRWRPVIPLGAPHATTTSDNYKGYYIPSGATVIANAWAMSRDKNRYPDPEAFIPERFLSSEGTLTEDDPATFVFGFGRRRCPGRHAADSSVWSGIATMLATMDFNAMKDGHGNDVNFEPRFSNGTSLHPLHFPCKLTPRAHITKETLRRYAK